MHKVKVYNNNKNNSNNNCSICYSYLQFHSLLWLVVAVMDRTVQWRHQVMRRKGYLKFYRKMKNVRRVPFAVVSTGLLRKQQRQES